MGGLAGRVRVIKREMVYNCDDVVVKEVTIALAGPRLPAQGH